MNNVAVTAHNLDSRLAAFQVVGVLPNRQVGRALGAVCASWPEHQAWVWAAFERGDFLVARTGVWFFQGEEAEQLAEG